MVVQNLAALSSNVGSKLPNLESVTITVQRVHTALTERKLLNQTLPRLEKSQMDVKNLEVSPNITWARKLLISGNLRRHISANTLGNKIYRQKIKKVVN